MSRDGSSATSLCQLDALNKSLSLTCPSFPPPSFSPSFFSSLPVFLFPFCLHKETYPFSYQTKGVETESACSVVGLSADFTAALVNFDHPSEVGILTFLPQSLGS